MPEIVPLSEATLPSAIHLVHRSFVHVTNTTNLPERSLRAALDPSLTEGHEDMQEITSRVYWVMTDDNDVHGVIGLMEFDDDCADTDWVNWYCVDPDHRGKGYGRLLLQKAINESIARGKTSLKLWTTNAANEADAQFLYEKMGFTVTETEDFDEGGDATLKFYRAKTLK